MVCYEKRTRKGCRHTNVQVRILGGVVTRIKQSLNDNVLVGRCTSSHKISEGREKNMAFNEKKIVVYPEHPMRVRTASLFYLPTHNQEGDTMYKDVPLRKQIHREHWMEPTAVTAERSKDDIFCEFCGEDIPWHNSKCSMLKNAYQRRYAPCTFCKKEVLVGLKMREHTETLHMAEVKKLRAARAKKTPIKKKVK